MFRQQQVVKIEGDNAKVEAGFDLTHSLRQYVLNMIFGVEFLTRDADLEIIKTDNDVRWLDQHGVKRSAP